MTIRVRASAGHGKDHLSPFGRHLHGVAPRGRTWDFHQVRAHPPHLHVLVHFFFFFVLPSRAYTKNRLHVLVHLECERPLLLIFGLYLAAWKRWQL